MNKKKLVKKWTAYYSPAINRKDPTKDFNTKKEAEDYIISRNCDMCKKDGLESMCAAEWEIIKSKDLAKCKNFGDILKATGWKEIKKQTTKNIKIINE